MPIVIENLTHIYGENTPYETKAVDGVSLNIEDGEFVGLIGHTGSGKSTLIQHLNGLLKPTSGRVSVNGSDTTNKAGLKELRRQVGLVFQYPEYQLFDETVEKDVYFGPKNLGVPASELPQRAKEAMELVELDYESIKDKSPFELSGGQKRLAAIAGVVAMRPDIIVLDEPVAGLDPKGRRTILRLIDKLHRSGHTIIMVSHNMEDLARLCTRLIVMDSGGIAMDGKPEDVFSDIEGLRAIGLDAPQAAVVAAQLRAKGYDVPMFYMAEDLGEWIIRRIRGESGV
ncbi:MAG: energy-coupling factor transporter ATPase [Christensenellales bacterium]|jgi:energy-coupling factor transport system ATP-binding protein